MFPECNLRIVKCNAVVSETRLHTMLLFGQAEPKSMILGQIPVWLTITRAVTVKPLNCGFNVRAPASKYCDLERSKTQLPSALSNVGSVEPLLIQVDESGQFSFTTASSSGARWLDNVISLAFAEF